MLMRKHRSLYTAALLILVVAAAGAVETPTPLTLQQAVAIGLERNPIRKAALAGERAARAGEREARAAFLPKITFAEAATRGNDPVYVFGAKLRQNTFTTSDFALNRLNTPTPIGNFATRFGGSWTVFDSFTSTLNLRRARQMAQIASSGVTRSDQELVYRIVDAYYGLLLAAKQAELAQETVKTAQAVLDSSRNRFEAGLAVESDLLAARVNLASRNQELITAKNALALARARLTIVLGMSTANVYQPAERLVERTLTEPVLEEAESRALEQRPDLKQIMLQREAQQTGVQLAKSSFGPRVNLYGDWELDNRSFAANGGNNWVAGAELQFDLFAGGQKSAALTRERALLDRATAMKQAASDNIRLDVRRAFYDHNAARQVIEVARAAVAQAEESLRIVQNRYDAGLTTITELLRAEDASRASRTNYWQSVYRYQTTYAALELATGSLTPNSPLVTP
jgi:outer membrane protein TolC